MKHSKRNNLIKISSAIVLGLILTGVIFGQEYFPFYGNTVTFSLTQLALVQQFSAMDCDSFAVVYATYTSGQKVKLAEGREGAIQPFIDSTKLAQLKLAIGAEEIKNMHAALELECGGKAMKGTTVVSGDIKLRLSIAGNKERYLNGFPADAAHPTIASQFQTIGFGPIQLEDGVRKQVYQRTISANEIESILGNDTKTNLFMKIEIYANYLFTFIHPTAGQFSGSVDTLTENKKVVGQYGGIIRTTEIIDTDGDGIPDNIDQCDTQPETFNGFEDEDGCPDTVPPDPNDPTDTDGDGIPDNVDQCPTQPETFNGFQDDDGCPDTIGKGLRINSYAPQVYDILDGSQVVNFSIGFENYVFGETTPTFISERLEGSIPSIETFPLPNVCLQTSNGFVDCSFSITLDLNKYSVGAHKFTLKSTERGELSAPFEVIDNSPINPNPDPDPEDLPEVIENIPEQIGEVGEQIRSFFIEPATSTPIEISEEDWLIIGILIAAVLIIFIIMRLVKKK